MDIHAAYEDDIIARRFCRLHSLAPHRLTALFHASLNLHEKDVFRISEYGSGSCFFLQLLSRCQQKNQFFLSFFFLSTYCRYRTPTISFQRQQAIKKSQNCTSQRFSQIRSNNYGFLDPGGSRSYRSNGKSIPHQSHSETSLTHLQMPSFTHFSLKYKLHDLPSYCSTKIYNACFERFCLIGLVWSWLSSWVRESKLGQLGTGPCSINK